MADSQHRRRYRRAEPDARRAVGLWPHQRRQRAGHRRHRRAPGSRGYAIDGQANARPAPGQAIQLVLNVRNLWLPGQSLQGTLASSDPYVSISDNAGAFGDIAPGQLGSNSGDPFGVTVSGGAPYNHASQFTLNLSGAGGYSLAVPFNIQVRSAVETLGNTIYTQNTTWTSDKTYVLAGTVIVNPGVDAHDPAGHGDQGQSGQVHPRGRHADRTRHGAAADRLHDQLDHERRRGAACASPTARSMPATMPTATTWPAACCSMWR